MRLSTVCKADWASDDAFVHCICFATLWKPFRANCSYCALVVSVVAQASSTVPLLTTCTGQLRQHKSTALSHIGGDVYSIAV